MSRNFSEDLILALLERLSRSLKFCIANNTLCLEIMQFIIYFFKFAKNLILIFLDKTLSVSIKSLSLGILLLFSLSCCCFLFIFYTFIGFIFQEETTDNKLMMKKIQKHTRCCHTKTRKTTLMVCIYLNVMYKINIIL